MKSCGGRLKIFSNLKVDAQPEVMPMNNVSVFMMMLISLALLRYLNTAGLAETDGEAARFEAENQYRRGGFASPGRSDFSRAF
jgi:hypothetical protein